MIKVKKPILPRKIETLFSPYQNLTKLTIEQIQEEVYRCSEVETSSGFLYFCVNYGKLQHPITGLPVNMRDSLYKWQNLACQEFLCNDYLISKKPRQVGFSSLVGLYALWRQLFFSSQNIAIVSLSLRESKRFLDRIKFSYDYLPPWLKQEKIEDKKTTFTFKSNKSKIISLPMTSDPARGDSLSLLILDEFAAYKNQSDTLAAAVPALSAGFGTPFTNESLPPQLFLISTFPDNPVDNEYVRILNESRSSSDADYHIIEVVTDDIPHYMDEEWHGKQKRTLGSRRYDIEIRGLEPSDAENAFLPGHILQNLIPVDPIRCDFLTGEVLDEEGFPLDLDAFSGLNEQFDDTVNYIKDLWIFNDPEPGRQYVLVGDVATGRGQDFSAFIVFDPASNNEQVAEYYSNRVDTEVFKRIIETVAKHYNNAKLSVENTGVGVSICDYFGNHLQYENFYFTKKNKYIYVPGFSMSSSTRANGIAYFGAMMERQEFNVKSLRLINELRAFGYKPSGRIEALGSAHDDLVMCMIQFAYLQQIGFAVTDEQIEDGLIFGFEDLDPETMEKLDEAQIDLKKHKTQYWQKVFDIDEGDFMNLSPQEQEELRILSALNGSPTFNSFHNQ